VVAFIRSTPALCHLVENIEPSEPETDSLGLARVLRRSAGYQLDSGQTLGSTPARKRRLPLGAVLAVLLVPRSEIRDMGGLSFCRCLSLGP